MMAGRRVQRSPDVAFRRPRNDLRSTNSRPLDYLSSSSSSSSSSYLDISRTTPIQSIRNFFFSPTARQRVRRRRSRNNLRSSSSSSLNSNLAYGTGFIKVHKRSEARKQKGKQKETQEEYRDQTQRITDARSTRRAQNHRPTTDAEILAVGAGLAKLAREQNKADLKGVRGARRSEVISVETAPGPIYRTPTVGLQSASIARSRRTDGHEEEEWESASDQGSDSSVDSGLVYGQETPQHFLRWGKERRKPVSRKSTIVDPKLFGGVNSLQGLLAEPVGYGDVSWDSASDFGQPDQQVGQTASNSSQVSMQRVYPVPTSDPSRFEAVRSSLTSGSEPYRFTGHDMVALRQPQPRTPVSANVYEPNGAISSATEEIVLQSASTSDYHISLAGAALAGVAGASVAAVTISGDQKERKHRSQGSEGRKAHSRANSKVESKHDRKREKRDDSDHDDRREKRRDKEKRETAGRSSDVGQDKKRDKQRDQAKGETREERRERRERRRDEKRGEVGERPSQASDVYKTQSEIAAYAFPTAVDPSRYETSEDTMRKEIHGSASEIVEQHPTPHIVTVDRTPDFSKEDDWSWENAHARKVQSDIDDRVSYHNDSCSPERTLHDAEDIYREVRQSTAPVDPAAISSAVAAVTTEERRLSRSEGRRDERRSDHDRGPERPRGRQSPRDPDEDRIQEEADRAYREIIMARKIASQVIRSRSASPDKSVINKYDEEEENELVRIVTPPGMEDLKKVSPYDAPNADFQPDVVITDPKQLRTMKGPLYIVDQDSTSPPYLKHDLDALGPRPYLNLVHPTPIPSPTPEKQTMGLDTNDGAEKQRHNQSSGVSNTATELEDGFVSSDAKGVTWGRNETKHYEVESPSEYHVEPNVSDENASEKTKGRRSRNADSKRSGWGAIAAGILADSAGMAAEGPREMYSEVEGQDREDWQDAIDTPDMDFEPRMTSAIRAQPDIGAEIPYSHNPGAFYDDVDFAATLAAGLQDTGFDPGLVINDPAFHRREPPLGSTSASDPDAPISGSMADFSAFNNELSDPQVSGHDGYVIGEIPETPKGWHTVSPPIGADTGEDEKQKHESSNELDKAPSSGEGWKSANREAETGSYFDEPKLSKKEQKKRDRAARKASLVDENLMQREPEEQATVATEPDSYSQSSKKAKKKSKKGLSDYHNEIVEPSPGDAVISVPIDAFQVVQKAEGDFGGKKSKKKSKRENEELDAGLLCKPPSEVGSEQGKPTSRKSKDKSRRRSEQYTEPAEAHLSTVTSPDLDIDELGKSEDMKSREVLDNLEQVDSQSILPAGASRYGGDEPRKLKNKSKGNSKDDYDDIRSLASATPSHDDDSKKNKKEKRSSGLWGLFSSRSDVGGRNEIPPDPRDDLEESKMKTKKSKRSPRVDNHEPHGPNDELIDEPEHQVLRNDDHDNPSQQHPEHCGLENESSSSVSGSIARDSFLGNAGILGADVGIAAALDTHQEQQQYSATTADQAAAENRKVRSPGSDNAKSDDPEVTVRQFRPSIDPQFGDLLPLPPSVPTSPNIQPLASLPELPESRPQTPESERFALWDKENRSIRRSLQDVPIRSPSFSAVPLKFILGTKSTPESPVGIKSPPALSLVTHSDSPSLPRKRGRSVRPTSWDSARGFRPLYLVESRNRRGSKTYNDFDSELPMSFKDGRILGGSVFPDAIGEDALLQSQSGNDEHDETNRMSRDDVAISITDVATGSSLSTGPGDHSKDAPLGIPADTAKDLPEVETLRKSWQDQVPLDLDASTYPFEDDGPVPNQHSQHITDNFASKEGQTYKQPSPINPVTKDRSSYLLHSSPPHALVENESISLLALAEGEGDIVEPKFEEVDLIEQRQQPLDASDSFTREPEDIDTMEENKMMPTLLLDSDKNEESASTRPQKRNEDKHDIRLSRLSSQEDMLQANPSQGALVDISQVDILKPQVDGEVKARDTDEALDANSLPNVGEDALGDSPAGRSKKNKKKGKKKTSARGPSIDQISPRVDLQEQVPCPDTRGISSIVSRDDANIMPEESLEPQPPSSPQASQPDDPRKLGATEGSSASAFKRSKKYKKSKQKASSSVAWDNSDPAAEPPVLAAKEGLEPSNDESQEATNLDDPQIPKDEHHACEHSSQGDQRLIEDMAPKPTIDPADLEKTSGASTADKANGNETSVTTLQLDPAINISSSLFQQPDGSETRRLESQIKKAKKKNKKARSCATESVASYLIVGESEVTQGPMQTDASVTTYPEEATPNPIGEFEDQEFSTSFQDIIETVSADHAAVTDTHSEKANSSPSHKGLKESVQPIKAGIDDEKQTTPTQDQATSPEAAGATGMMPIAPISSNNSRKRVVPEDPITAALEEISRQKSKSKQGKKSRKSKSQPFALEGRSSAATSSIFLDEACTQAGSSIQALQDEDNILPRTMESRGISEPTNLDTEAPTVSRFNVDFNNNKVSFTSTDHQVSLSKNDFHLDDEGSSSKYEHEYASRTDSLPLIESRHESSRDLLDGSTSHRHHDELRDNAHATAAENSVTSASANGNTTSVSEAFVARQSLDPAQIMRQDWSFEDETLEPLHMSKLQDHQEQAVPAADDLQDSMAECKIEAEHNDGEHLTFEQLKGELPDTKQSEVKLPELPELDHSELKLSEVKQSGVSLPELDQPELELSEVKQPELPELEQPELRLSEAEQLGVKSPELHQPELELSEAEQSEVKSPELHQPELRLSKVERAEMKRPELKQSIINQPVLQQPKVERPDSGQHSKAQTQLSSKDHESTLKENLAESPHSHMSKVILGPALSSQIPSLKDANDAPEPLTPSNLSFASRHNSQELRPDSSQSHRSISSLKIHRLRTPDSIHRVRPDSSNSSRRSSGRSGTPPLRRSDRKFSGDLRSLSQRSSRHDLAKEAEFALLTSAAASSIASSATPTANEGRVRAKDMADVYVSHLNELTQSSACLASIDKTLQYGFGEGRIGSPRSPTRPHSMRRRQSMQVLDLESKVEQLVAETRALSEAKLQAEQLLRNAQQAPAALADRDAEIDSLKRTVEWMQKEVARLSEVNEGLTSANVTLGRQQNERYNLLESQYVQTMQELAEERNAHDTLSTDMAIGAQSHDPILQKDREIAQLQSELEVTKEQVRRIQQQILTTKVGDNDFLTTRDEDYFDTCCQQLCQHVQQWVLRFSKFSDMRACRLTSEINNDKIIDRLDNAILDGSDVDTYLADRIKRRDVFMSMTMTMIWEFIFTRYLFGMDRDQRQKLKSLEKLLSEVGPLAAVHQWRATTLTLLSKRPAFALQREQDTEAVMNAILETLTEILPPPSNLEAQIESQLKRVIRSAVDLSIDMRTQRAEYMMLPPLQPEYDANGELTSKVTFNAALMNERSGDTVSNEDLEAQKAVVRIVLFPLVVKRGDDRGDGDEEIVICPAQVLVARPKINKGKSVRVLNPDEAMGNSILSEQGEGAWDNRSKASLQSAMPSTMEEMEQNVSDENVI